MTSPRYSIRLRPKRSDSGPYTSWPTARPRKKAVMSRDGCVESAASPKSLRMSGNAGSNRSMDMAAIAIHVAMKATKVRPPSSIRRRSATCAIAATLGDDGPHQSQPIDRKHDLVAALQPGIGLVAVHERQLEDAAGATRP